MLELLVDLSHWTPCQYFEIRGRSFTRRPL
jgi:hypothetical protein